MSALPRSTITIPAYEPTAALAELVDALAPDGRDIIVVNDGSSAPSHAIFARVTAQPRVTLLTHDVNLGKGQALKTAFAFFLSNATPDAVGIVTADADGQHLAEDIRRIAERLEQEPDVALVLGSRVFGKTAPLRSRVGNALTQRVFRMLIRRALTDTQTGLRGIPRSFLPELIAMAGQRYEFELEMLVRAVRHGLPIIEVPITTVYGGLGQSHFNPFGDSVRVYAVFVRFLSLSLLSAVVDYLLFVLTFLMSGSILASTVVARTIAATFNFACNRGLVFRSKGSIHHEALKYALTAFGVMGLSYALLVLLVVFGGLTVYIAKPLADVTLFFASFAAQHLFVFRHRHRLKSAPVTASSNREAAGPASASRR